MGMVNINRPIHLALRDGSYEKFLGLLKPSFEGRPLASLGLELGVLLVPGLVSFLVAVRVFRWH